MLIQNMAIGAVSGFAASWFPLCHLDAQLGGAYRTSFLRPRSRFLLSVGLATWATGIARSWFSPTSDTSSPSRTAFLTGLTTSLVGWHTSEHLLRMALERGWSMGRGYVTMVAVASLAAFLTYNPLAFLNWGAGSTPTVQAGITP